MPVQDPRNIELVKRVVTQVCNDTHRDYMIIHHILVNWWDDDVTEERVREHAQLVMSSFSRPVRHEPLEVSPPTPKYSGLSAPSSSLQPSWSPGPSQPRSSTLHGLTSVPPTGEAFEFGGRGFTSIDKEAYLKQLEEQEQTVSSQSHQPLVRKIVATSLLTNPSPTIGHPKYCSNDIESRSNQECVLAAMATVAGEIRMAQALQGIMTSTDSGILKAAQGMNLSHVEMRDLEAILIVGKRVFIRTSALSGGVLHAYCAFAYDATNKYVYAWDPDNNHRDVKRIPIEYVDEHILYTAK